MYEDLSPTEVAALRDADDSWQIVDVREPWEIEIVAGSGPLGGLYVLSDSIAVAACVHALHDVVGFSVFALQRRTRWFL